MIILSERIKNRRADLELRQDDVALALNLASSTVYLYERSNKDLKTSVARRLASILKCSVDYLTGKSDEVGESPEEFDKEEKTNKKEIDLVKNQQEMIEVLKQFLGDVKKELSESRKELSESKKEIERLKLVEEDYRILTQRMREIEFEANLKRDLEKDTQIKPTRRAV